MRRSIEDRFWAKVDVRDNGGCWLWVASLDAHGYGQIHFNRRTVKSHRLAYELLVGHIPAGLDIDHLCGIPPCVNPAHLEPVPHHVNLQRRVGKNSNNTSGHRGVVWNRNSRKWYVQVTARGIRHYGGTFIDANEAAEAAKRLRRTLHSTVGEQ